MAVNSLAVGAAGLAVVAVGLAAEAAKLSVAASGAGVGGPEVVAVPHPLDDVRAIFTTLGMTNTQRCGMMNVHKHGKF